MDIDEALNFQRGRLDGRGLRLRRLKYLDGLRFISVAGGTTAASEWPSAATLAMAPAMALKEVTERSFAAVGAGVAVGLLVTS